MERLHNENDLAKFLLKQRKRKITIVSAFASGTAKLLRSIVAANDVEVILGTINAFTSPSFIDEAKTLLKRRLWVDFRGNASIHWKLYLISPNTVIIGSANFTNQGVALGQDTCVVIENTDLYNDYQQQLEVLKKERQVMAPGAPDFDAALERHREQHNRNQAALQTAQQASRYVSERRTSKVPSFDVWVQQGFLTIPLFIWEKNHSQEEKDEVSKIMRDQDAVVTHIAGRTKKPADSAARLFRDFLSEESNGPRPSFDPNTIVLATKPSGAYMRFMQLDIIVRNAQRKRDLMIELPKARYMQPFEITPAIKAAIVRLIEKEVCGHYAIPVDALQAELLNG
ncbi:hypothetical protein D3C85_505050 [compost metagenome]